MDRSRGGGTKQARLSSQPSEQQVPAASRLTVRARKNRRRPGSLWSRMPRPRVVADACGRAVRRSLPAVAATAAITAVGTGVWLGYRFVTTSERFAITSIEITGDRAPDRGPGPRGDPGPARRQRVRDQPRHRRPARCAGARGSPPPTAHRVLPSTLVIEVREHAAAAIVDLGELYLATPAATRSSARSSMLGDGAGLPVVTGIARAAYERDPAGTAALDQRGRSPRSRPGASTRPARRSARSTSTRTARSRCAPTTTRPRSSSARSAPQLAARMHTFDAAWAELTDAERTRARAIHLDARPDQVTVALHPDAPHPVAPARTAVHAKD